MASEKVSRKLTVLAAGAHPDDIEFGMAGTLLLLKDAGAAIHMWNVANGSCGTATHEKDEIIRIRWAEAQAAASVAGAVMHPPITDDLAVFYEPELVAKAAAVVREVKPDIMLIPSLEDYMEDHMNTGRILVTAGFVRAMRNFECIPPTPTWEAETVLYHAMPAGLRTGMRKLVHPELFVDVTSTIPTKRQMLAQHRSQKEWLDLSQGMDTYLNSMENMNRRVGEMSGRFACAEGWRRHNPLGYGRLDYDPLAELLKGKCWIDPEYRRSLE